MFTLKSSPNVSCQLGYFVNITFQVKTALAKFWASFVNIWAIFYFSIWSHLLGTFAAGQPLRSQIDLQVKRDF